MWIFFNGYRTKYWNKRRFISTYPRQSEGYGRVVVNGWKKDSPVFCRTDEGKYGATLWRVENTLGLFEINRYIWQGIVSSMSSKPDTFELVTTLKSSKHGPPFNSIFHLFHHFKCCFWSAQFHQQKFDIKPGIALARGSTSQKNISNHNNRKALV